MDFLDPLNSGLVTVLEPERGVRRGGRECFQRRSTLDQWSEDKRSPTIPLLLRSVNVVVGGAKEPSVTKGAREEWERLKLEA